MEIIRVRERTDTNIIFASMEDMKSFFDQMMNGQGVIFEYVDSKDERCGEYINPVILTRINDNKINLTSKEGK